MLNLAAIGQFHTARPQFVSDLPGAFEMPRHQHQKQFGKPARSRCAISASRISSPAWVLPPTESGRPAPRPVAAAWPAHRARGAPPAGPRQISSCRRRGWPPAGSRLRAGAPRPFRFGADTREGREQRPEQKAKSFITAIRAVGQPRVGQKNRDAEVAAPARENWARFPPRPGRWPPG